MRGTDVERAVGRTAIGMIRETPCATSAGWRCSFGIGGLAPQPRQDLLADALDRVGVEARLVQREPQQVEALVLAVLQACASSRGNSRGVDREAQLDRLLFQPLAGRPWRRVRRRPRRAATRPCSRRPACRPDPAVAPPTKAKFERDQRHDGSRTSQASMPPGETTRCDRGRARRLRRRARRSAAPRRQ